MRCTTCSNQAEHNLGYTFLVDESVDWNGVYCTECLVKKLRGMAKVWNGKIKKYCQKCNKELKDKRNKICDVCSGLEYTGSD